MTRQPVTEHDLTRAFDLMTRYCVGAGLGLLALIAVFFIGAF